MVPPATKNLEHEIAWRPSLPVVRIHAHIVKDAPARLMLVPDALARQDGEEAPGGKSTR
jgi:hypothetical protein